MDVWHLCTPTAPGTKKATAMPIDHWLRTLPQPDHSAIDGDLEALAGRQHPFLTDQCACKQIEQLSGHLGARHREVRRMVIAYSLYIRQVDVILEGGARSFCKDGCPTPPAGCCNHNHFVTMNIADLMSSRNSPSALHMAHVIGLMQKLETGHNRQGRTMRTGYCSLLAEDGCTLRLFKSPRCAHYLCETLENALKTSTLDKCSPFLKAMKNAESTTISSPADYCSPSVLAEAVVLFGHLRPQEEPQ